MLGPVFSALRRGVLVGGLLGALLGTANLAVLGAEGRDPVRYGLDWVVGGAFLGLIAGGVRAVGDTRSWRTPTATPVVSPEDRPADEATTDTEKSA